MVRFQLFVCLLVILFGAGNAKWDEYQILAFIGKPPVIPAQLIVDLSSSDIWVYSSDCKNCPQSAHALPNLTSSADSDFKLDFTTKDNDKSGTIRGVIATDEILLDPDVHTLKETKSHKYGLVTSIEGADETVDPYGQQMSGRIGLGLNKNSQTSSVDLLFGNYDKLLCFLQAGDFVGSILTLGQKMLDEQVTYNKLASAEVVANNNDLWVVTVSGYEFGKYSAFQDFSAQLSTTTSYISVPSQLYTQVTRLLNTYVQGDNLLMRCDGKNKAPTLELEINGYSFKIGPDTYIVDGPNSNECIVKVRQVEDPEDYFVLGISFLDSMSFCLNYDTKTVDFLTVTGLKN